MVLASAPGLLSTSLRHNVIFLTVLVASLIYGLRETGRRALDRRSIRPRRRHVGLWRAAAPNRYASDRNSLVAKGRPIVEVGALVAASAGAACHSGEVRVSHVLRAMNVPEVGKAWHIGKVLFEKWWLACPARTLVASSQKRWWKALIEARWKNSPPGLWKPVKFSCSSQCWLASA